MNKPKATVIIPYYKKKDTIKRAIKSVILQTYKNLELILIYDDQENLDLKFLKNLKKLDKRIRIIVNKKNLGAGRSRNIGIFNSKGKYICFLDADDSWKKNKLSFQIDFMISKF